MNMKYFISRKSFRDINSFFLQYGRGIKVNIQISHFFFHISYFLKISTGPNQFESKIGKSLILLSLPKYSLITMKTLFYKCTYRCRYIEIYTCMSTLYNINSHIY